MSTHGDSRRFRLGLFALGVGGMFLALLGFILQNSLDSHQESYFIMFQDNVKGMVVGSKVNFQGVPIGVVTDMRFQDGQTLVELRVDPSRASIQDITRARMDRLLVTGQVTVELEGYGADGRPLSPGAFIHPKEDPLNALKASLPEVVGQAADVLGRLDRVLAAAEGLMDPGNRASVAATLRHVERAAAAVADETVPQFAALLADARRAVQAAEGSADAVTGSSRAVESTLLALQRLEHDVRDLLHESTAVVVGVRGPTLATFAGVRSTLDDLRGLLRQLKLAPDSLLFGVNHASPPAGGDR